MANKKYYWWKNIKEYADKKMKANYLLPNGGCDSCCPECKEWEYQGNRIITESLDDGSEKRSCAKCNHTWRAIFTPAGFIPIKGGTK